MVARVTDVARELVGRDAEIEAADRFLDATRNGPAALLLEGEPGIGKTTVWREAVRHAEERGYRVLNVGAGRNGSRER